MLSHRSRVANLRFTMNALRAPLSASPACVTMWPSRRRNACADERSLLTYRLVQRLGADHNILEDIIADIANNPFLDIERRNSILENIEDVRGHYTNASISSNVAKKHHQQMMQLNIFFKGAAVMATIIALVYTIFDESIIESFVEENMPRGTVNSFAQIDITAW